MAGDISPGSANAACRADKAELEPIDLNRLGGSGELPLPTSD
jgi:hypothetical protein